ncbi:hypothetical protein I6N98_04695 [Spongiibacter nanhainus]|uniref:Uncharacterized protein n=1 Tax=Spongiibacter nanhainus TaxID=2794344 RepID=A0A7T4UQW1_9GAMM|nr:DUF6491 family protein [Spongiibacter nanhainus]QQD19158.1 hypothetical protein I6N98_04695 [Spongiibacter nanhainus]
MNKIRRFLRAAVCAAPLFVGATLAHAETEATGTEASSQRCVAINRIDQLKVVDRENVLFYMRGKEVYLNQLPHPCPGLSRHKTLMYRTSLNQLCDVDVITVLEDIGGGFMPGASCGLGAFTPISAEEAETLLDEARK